MATKTQVARKAAIKECELVVEDQLVTLYPPLGYRLGEYHVVGREAGWSASKSDIYDELLDLLDDLAQCVPECPNC